MFKSKSLFIVALVVVFAALSVIPALAQDKIEVPVWIAFQDDNRLGWTQAVADAFNEAHPEYNVTVTGYANYEELFAATALAAEQNALPAIVQYFEVATQVARDSGYFKSIAEALGDRTEVLGVPVNLEDIIGVVSAYYTLDGQWTSMPWNTSSAIMFSNMNYLTAAGIDTPPATWSEVAAACEAIMAADGAPEYCFTWPNHGWFFEQWLAQQNGLYANNDNGRAERATEVAFNSPEGVAVLQWLDDMVAAGYLYYSGAQGGDSWATVDQAFQAQTVAMAVYSSSDTGVYTQTGVDNGFEVQASFMPYNDAVEYTGNLLGGASLWLTNALTPEQEEGALAFLLTISNTENAAVWSSEITGYIAVRQSAIELLTEQGFYDENPNFTVAAAQLAQSQVTPATSGALLGPFNAIRDIVTRAIDTVLLTDEDPQAVLDAAAEEANALIEEYNLLNVE
ncbi:MAG: extracellular solute-binding protein [Chitinophagaceae bacterium]|nr:extracellular solute-binding protein [Anaerolineae bacterium]